MMKHRNPPLLFHNEKQSEGIIFFTALEKKTHEKQKCQNWTEQTDATQIFSSRSVYLEQFIVLYVSVPIWQTQLTSGPLYKHSCGADHLETSYFGAIGEFLPSDTVASVAFNQPLLLGFV